MLFRSLAIRWPLLKILWRSYARPPEALNARGVAIYNDVVGHVKGYISEMVQDTASGTINDL